MSSTSALGRLGRPASAFRRSAAASAVVLALPLAAPAQDLTLAYADLPPVVVTAARLEQPLADALPSTVVIERDEIERHAAPDLASLLRMLTSADVAQAGPLGAQTSVFLRGGDSRQTLVLVDGLPINRADFGTPSLQHLPIAQIERIEIVRGNVSSLYGAQAVGGVIQVFTRRATAPQASVELGSRGGRAASVAAGLRLGDRATPTELHASLSTRRTDGYSAKDPDTSPGANPDDDAARQQGASLHVAQTWAEGHRTRLGLMAARTRSAFDAFTPGLDDELTTRLGAWSLDSQHRLASGLDLALDLGTVHERFVDPTGPVNFGAERGRNRVQRAAAQLQWQAAAGHTLQFGLETQRERFGDSNTATRTRRNNAQRLAWIARPDGAPWTAQLALRHDDNDSHGRETTGLLALAWQLAPRWRLSGQLSTAFSAPSLIDEQFADPAARLEAERSRSGELALQWTEGANRVRAAWFVQRQRDRVAFDSAPPFFARNIARASNHGIELLAQATIGPGRLGAEATFQDPRDDTADRRLLRRSRSSAALRWTQDTAGWEWGAALRHVGERDDFDPASFTIARNRARTTADLTLGRQVAPGWRLGVKVENLGDSERPDVLGFNANPRGVFVSLNWDGAR